uniref:Uncharacterized protein n=1 Tax=Arundo donax TaxID=35708 RepID=A0A0A8Y7U4_ARUDO
MHNHRSKSTSQMHLCKRLALQPTTKSTSQESNLQNF